MSYFSVSKIVSPNGISAGLISKSGALFKMKYLQHSSIISPVSLFLTTSTPTTILSPVL
jgi:hypothetical protein